MGLPLGHIRAANLVLLRESNEIIMKKEATGKNNQKDKKESRECKRELEIWEKKVHPDTVTAVKETAEQYKNVLIELANR